MANTYVTSGKAGQKARANVEEIITVLRPCIVTYTHNSTHIKTDMGDMMFTNGGGKLNLRELAFIKRFREHYVRVGKGLDYDLGYAKVKPVYQKFNPWQGLAKDVVEIDIRRAYPTAGRILGIVNDQFYEEGIKFPKQTFLIAIGSLNRKRKTIAVDQTGRRKILREEKPMPYMSNLWSSIVGYIDFVMQKAWALAGADARFYWCDAIFVRRRSARKIQELLLQYGFESRVVTLKKLEWGPEHILAINEYGDKKTYCYPQTKIVNYENLNEVARKFIRK